MIVSEMRSLAELAGVPLRSVRPTVKPLHFPNLTSGSTVSATLTVPAGVCFVVTRALMDAVPRDGETGQPLWNLRQAHYGDRITLTIQGNGEMKLSGSPRTILGDTFLVLLPGQYTVNLGLTTNAVGFTTSDLRLFVYLVLHGFRIPEGAASVLSDLQVTELNA